MEWLPALHGPGGSKGIAELQNGSSLKAVIKKITLK